MCGPDRTTGLRGHRPPVYPDTLAFHTSYSTVPSFTLEMLMLFMMLPDRNVHIHDFIRLDNVTPRAPTTKTSSHWQKLIVFHSA